MTIECDGVINAKKQIENLNPRKLDGLRAAHSPGDYVRIVVSDEYEGLHEMAFKKFHAMRDELADSMGDADKEYVKALLKLRHGISIPWVDGFKPPLGQRGAFVEVEERIYWLKSSTVMTTDELTKMILGTEQDIAELGGDTGGKR